MSTNERQIGGISPSAGDGRDGGKHDRYRITEWMPMLVALAIAALVRAGVLGSIAW
jgi:hypothetical protein